MQLLFSLTCLSDLYCAFGSAHIPAYVAHYYEISINPFITHRLIRLR